MAGPQRAFHPTVRHLSRGFDAAPLARAAPGASQPAGMKREATRWEDAACTKKMMGRQTRDDEY
jgi:hypothetical protein